MTEIDKAIVAIKEHNRIHQKMEPNAVFITRYLNMAIQALEEKAEREKEDKDGEFFDMGSLSLLGLRSFRTVYRPFETMPSELISMPQWVCHRYPNKTPLSPRVGCEGELPVASCRNSLTWGNFIDAVQVVVDGHALGIGFQLANGICGIDLDNCIEDGRLSEFACKIVNRLGSYAEISPSGTGVHILCRASMPLLKGFRDCVRGLDVSFSNRYFIVTGNALLDENGQPYPLKECSEQVGLLMTEEVDL